MTAGKALETLLGRFRVGARVIACEEDDTTYIPEPLSVAVVQAFVDRPLTEDDFWFVIGCGATPTHYAMRSEVIEEAVKKGYPDSSVE